MNQPLTVSIDLAQLDSLPTYDPERDTPGMMELRSQFNDGDYFKVEDVRQLARRSLTSGAPAEPVAQVDLENGCWMDIGVSEIAGWEVRKFKTRTLYAAPVHGVAAPTCPWCEKSALAPASKGDTTNFQCGECLNLSHAAAPVHDAATPSMADAYVGAREDLAIWKKRALEAENACRRAAAPSRDAVLQLLNHIEDVVDDKNWEKIDPALWNAVTEPKASAAAKTDHAPCKHCDGQGVIYDDEMPMRCSTCGGSKVDPGGLPICRECGAASAGSDQAPCETCSGKGGTVTSSRVDPESGPEYEIDYCGDCGGLGRVDAPSVTVQDDRVLREAVRAIVQLVQNGEWADLLHTDADVVALWDVVDGLLRRAAHPVQDGEKDAQRYRSWRDHMLAGDPKFVDAIQAALPADVGDSSEPTAAEWDAAIDAAMVAAHPVQDGEKDAKGGVA